MLWRELGVTVPSLSRLTLEDSYVEDIYDRYFSSCGTWIADNSTTETNIGTLVNALLEIKWKRAAGKFLDFKFFDKVDP